MAQFMVLILASLAIIFLNLNSLNAQITSESNNKVVNEMVIKDTLLITSVQYEIIRNIGGVFHIKISNKVLLEKIKEYSNPIILKIEIENCYYIAKGIDVFSSSVPDDCDYFFPLNSKGNFFLWERTQ